MKIIIIFINLSQILLLLLLHSSNQQCCWAYNVVNFGARGDGKTDSTAAFLRTWNAACRSLSPSGTVKVDVPRGVFKLRTTNFKGPCRSSRIELRIDGTIVAPHDHYALGNSGFWIQFYKVSKLTIYGGGIFDARGARYWSCRRHGQSCPVAAKSISIMWCNDVIVKGITSLDSRSMHMGIVNSRNVKMMNLKIRAPSGSPNTDGIHVQKSMDVSITNSIIRTGDDCISIGPGSFNLFISHIGCGPGHGISIGSLGNSKNEEGVKNVTVTDSVFTKTQNGVRVKSWGKPSVGGYATNLLFKNLIMRNVENPIIIDQQYCPYNNCPPRQNSGVRISEVTYKNIKGISATETAMKFECSATNPCKGITLQDINLSYYYLMKYPKPTFAYCNNAIGTHKGFVFPKSCL